MNFVTQRVRANMKVSLTCFLLFAFISSCTAELEESPEAYFSRFIADLWVEGADVLKIIWRDCSKKLVDVKDVIDHQEFFPKFVRCMKRKTLRALDRSLSPDVVPIAEGVSLVRFEIVDPSGNIVTDSEASAWSDKELDERDWRTLALQRMARVLRTHVIKFDFEGNSTLDKVEYRGRRRHHMLTMMMFGIVSIGMVLVPMGFQFLAVLGGKALLLAKMALILASVQSLKKVETNFEPYHERGKIASSPVNYGFYHAFPPYDQYQKRSQDDLLPQVIHLRSISAQSPGEMDEGVKIDKIYSTIAQPQKKQLEGSKDITTADKAPLTTTNMHKLKERIFPIFDVASSGTIDTPYHIDLTTTPSEVQTDYSLELPYNRFNFQSPSTVVSA